jgi:uncharacterized protein YbgA (DUF1722 family)/uncharacterized protein YbbK (DUF523 family)
MSFDLPPRPEAPLKIGISECLLGREVRYDGSGAKSSFPHAKLEGLFDYVSVCPEVGIGMTVPREPIRLVGSVDDYRVVGVKDRSIDKTDALRAYGQDKAKTFADLSGYIFMHNSPSCGLFRVKVYPEQDGPAIRQGRGIYAGAVLDALPDLPAEEGGRMFDDVLRENFVTRAFAYAHWREVSADLTARRLIAFHSAYKYLLMAHSSVAYKRTGQLLSNLKVDLTTTAQTYISLLMNGLKSPATPKSHANVLAHLQGYLKTALSSPERQELDQLIQAYRRGEQPLLAPITLLTHHFKRHPDEYVLMQSYLNPHPTQSGLRRSL